MRTLIPLILALLFAAAPTISHGAKPSCNSRSTCKAECEKTKEKIRSIQARMRQGYSASQGARMEADLRDLRKRRSKVCR